MIDRETGLLSLAMKRSADRKRGAPRQPRPSGCLSIQLTINFRCWKHQWPSITMSVRVDKLAYGKAVGNFLRGEIAMPKSLYGQGHRLLLGYVLVGRQCVDRPWFHFAVSG
jgi:hypothetical protein